MRTTYTYYCPHCGNILYSGFSKQGKVFGFTIMKCNKCGNPFYNSNVYEWENLTNDEKLAVLVNGTDGYIITKKEAKKDLFIILFTFFLIIPLLVLPTEIGILRRYKKFKFSKELVEKNEAIQKSIERTSNEEYKKELLRLGREFYGRECN